MPRRTAQLTKYELELFKMMNASEQASVKRLMWMIEDVYEDVKAAEYQEMLEALFQGTYMKFVDSSGKRYK